MRNGLQRCWSCPFCNNPYIAEQTAYSHCWAYVQFPLVPLALATCAILHKRLAQFLRRGSVASIRAVEQLATAQTINSTCYGHVAHNMPRSAPIVWSRISCERSVEIVGITPQNPLRAPWRQLPQNQSKRDKTSENLSKPLKTSENLSFGNGRPWILRDARCHL